jgi:GntR family transcriptional regulator, transcriptional repressor for pyruvate dehydrogenase complex
LPAHIEVYVTITGPPAGRREQLRQPRLAEVVAGVLRERIVTGELGDGDLLPKQDELIEEYRISRPTLREALRILEGEGLLIVRRGSVGGSVVRMPTADASAYTFGLLLQSRGASIGDLATAIKHIEPITASLCAARPDRASSVVPALRANLAGTEAATSDGPQFTALARQFHELLVGCCGNETLIVAFGALESLWSEQERQWAVRAASEGFYPEERYRRDVLAAHTALLAAIERGDAEAAGRLDASHLQHSQRFTLDGSESRVVRATPLRDGLRDLSM